MLQVEGKDPVFTLYISILMNINRKMISSQFGRWLWCF